MPTIPQIIRKGRHPKKKKSRTPALKGAPQARGTVNSVHITSPKKPNSANRKVVKARLSTGKIVTASIPGIGHSIQENATILLGGGGAQDTGSKLHVIRGTRDVSGVEGRQQGRSKFGASKPKDKK